MTKAEFIAEVSAITGQTQRDVLRTLDVAFRSVIRSVLVADSFRWPGFGSWRWVRRKARRLRNPQTNEWMTLPVSFTLAFRAAKAARAKMAKRAA